MKIFDHTHARGKYWQHLIRASFVAGLFICAGLLGLVHAITRFFLPELMSEANKRIAKELEQRMCECD